LVKLLVLLLELKVKVKLYVNLTRPSTTRDLALLVVEVILTTVTELVSVTLNGKVNLS